MDPNSMQAQKSLKIKPPVSTAAKAAALRAQLQLELQNKKQCTYKPYECTQLTLDRYNYCLRHILEDKGASFRKCAYVFTSTGKRCHLPAPKGDKKDLAYCNEHALKTHLSKAKQGIRYPPPPTAEVLLHSLSHYVKKPRSRTISSTTQYSDEGGRTTPEEGSSSVTKSLDPFTEIDAHSICASRSYVLDMCSESESDVDAATQATVWGDAQADSSDNESIDSEQEDVLKHANVFTAEEITSVTREKLIRLQSLYIDQYRHLQHLLKERRRKYLYNLKREKETCCSIYKQVRDSPKEQRLYKKLKAYNKYHRKYGVDAILSKKVNELRAKITDGIASKPPTFAKCAFTEGGVKCGERALPVARHCRKHIMEDPNQVLFRACGKMKADVECTTPVEAIFDDTTCALHIDIPPIRSYNQIRKDSESDYDDSMEAANSSFNQSNFSSNVKTEFLSNSIFSGFAPLKSEEIKEEIPDNLLGIDMDTSELFDMSSSPKLPDIKSDSHTFSLGDISNTEDISALSVDGHQDEKMDLSIEKKEVKQEPIYESTK